MLTASVACGESPELSSSGQQSELQGSTNSNERVLMELVVRGRGLEIKSQMQSRLFHLKPPSEEWSAGLVTDTAFES